MLIALSLGAAAQSYYSTYQVPNGKYNKKSPSLIIIQYTQKEYVAPVEIYNPEDPMDNFTLSNNYAIYSKDMISITKDNTHTHELKLFCPYDMVSKTYTLLDSSGNRYYVDVNNKKRITFYTSKVLHIKYR